MSRIGGVGGDGDERVDDGDDDNDKDDDTDTDTDADTARDRPARPRRSLAGAGWTAQ